MDLKIKTELQQDGFIKVFVDDYGVTWAKDLEDIGVAISELIQVTKQRKVNFIKIVNGS